MKIFKILFSLIFLFMVFSCNNDDDVCTSGEATPRLKMKFKSLATGKLKTLDTLYVFVDYGSGPKQVFGKANVDSVLVSMKVDGSNFTDIYVQTRTKGNSSKIKVKYTTESQYVSPACGIKKLYQNVSSELVTPNPVLSIEQNQTQILDEKKTTLYLDF